MTNEPRAIELLHDPRLLDRIVEDFSRCGVVGQLILMRWKLFPVGEIGTAATILLSTEVLLPLERSHVPAGDCTGSGGPVAPERILPEAKLTMRVAGGDDFFIRRDREADEVSILGLLQFRGTHPTADKCSRGSRPAFRRQWPAICCRGLKQQRLFPQECRA